MQQIIGQDSPRRIIQAALRSDRVHHAWLFHGPVGVGKFTFAQQVARTLLCHDRQTDSQGDVIACGACQSCHLFDAPESAHPDMHVVNKEMAGESTITNLRNRKQMNIPIDLLRERMVGGWVGSGEAKKYYDPVVARTPMLRHGKVFIIDEAELLAHGRNETQNALLKTLEEPTDQTYIFLITSSEDRLLPTIRSRCQRVAFARLSESDLDSLLDGVAQRLSHRLQARRDALAETKRATKAVKERIDSIDQQLEQLKLAPSLRQRVINMAQGSVGYAEVVLAYGLYDWARRVEPAVEQLAGGHLPAQMGGELAALVDEFAVNWVDTHAGASKDAANKLAGRHMLGLIAELCRQRTGQLARTLADGSPEQAESALRPWLAGIDQVRAAEQAMAANVSLPLIMDNLVVQWAATVRSGVPALI